MMLNRKRFVLVGLAVLALAVAAAVFAVPRWLESRTSDCDRVSQMITKSTEGRDALTNLALESQDHPQDAVEAYHQRNAAMRNIAEHIGAGDIRQQALHLVALDESIIDSWSTAVSEPPGGSAAEASAAQDRFVQTYQRYAVDHKKTMDSLMNSCPGAHNA